MLILKTFKFVYLKETFKHNICKIHYLAIIILI